MARSYKGRIALDIRDLEPDWMPFLAPQTPEGAPNGPAIAWDDVGYGALDVFPVVTGRGCEPGS